MYVILLALVSTLLGTFIALRLMAIEERETPTTLTTRGKIVVALLCGMAIATIVIVINGMWWDCDLRPNSTSRCSFRWGY